MTVRQAPLKLDFLIIGAGTLLTDLREPESHHLTQALEALQLHSPSPVQDIVCGSLTNLMEGAR